MFGGEEAGGDGEVDEFGEDGLQGGVVGEFAGEVGVDGAVPGQVGGFVAQPEHGGQVGGELHQRGAPRPDGGVGGAVAALAGAGEVVFAVHEREVGIHEALLGVAGVVVTHGGGDLA